MPPPAVEEPPAPLPPPPPEVDEATTADGAAAPPSRILAGNAIGAMDAADDDGVGWLDADDVQAAVATGELAFDGRRCADDAMPRAVRVRVRHGGLRDAERAAAARPAIGRRRRPRDRADEALGPAVRRLLPPRGRRKQIVLLAVRLDAAPEGWPSASTRRARGAST